MSELERWLVAEGFRRTKSGPTVPGGSTLVDVYARDAFSIEIVRHEGSWHLHVALNQAAPHAFDLGVIEAALTGNAIDLEAMPLDRECRFVREHLPEMIALTTGDDPASVIPALEALRETRARVRMPGLSGSA